MRETELHRRTSRLRFNRSWIARVLGSWLVRAFVVVLVSSLSGAAHMALDARAGWSEIADATGGDCTDPADCPPGCPSCHGHPAAAGAALAARHVEVARAPMLAQHAPSSTATPPPSSDRSEVFRPPRS